MYAVANRVPVFGSVLRSLSRVALPNDVLVLASIRSCPGKGYEATVERVLLSNLRPGTVFYDVGAHIGVFSLIAARNIGIYCSVIAFEPDPSNVRGIDEHVSRNQLDRIRIIPKAVCSSVGRVRFQRASFQSSMNRGTVIDHASAAEDSTIEVESVTSVTLDAIALENPPPNLIKIDVEGAEASVLQGSEENFRSAKPVLV